jgi:phosphatidyl-myo-inositol dimannoside synthase
VCVAKSIVFVHGLDLVVGSVIYQSIFLPFIRRADLVIANSQNTRKIAVTKQVPKARIMVINPGTELPDISAIKAGEDFCRRHNIPFKKIMIFIGRMTRRKGLSRFIENSLPAILEAEPESGLVVVGNDPHQSLTDFGEMKEIVEVAKRLHLEDSIIFLGNLGDDELLACYATADVQIFPLIEVSDDIEGFGMVAIEAAACGTPTAAFAIGGVGDAISEKNGLLINPDDYDSFTAGVITILQTGLPSAASCMDHASNFDWSIYNAKLKMGLQPLSFANPGNWDYPPVA